MVGKTKNQLPKAVTITLPVECWRRGTLTVRVEGVTAENAIIASPAPVSLHAAGRAGVYCSAQSKGCLTFACTVSPPVDLTYNVIIQEVR